MRFYSEEFSNMKEYRKQRKALIEQIKKEFGVTGRIGLPKNSIILQANQGNGWYCLTDESYEVENYINFNGIKRLTTVELITK